MWKKIMETNPIVLKNWKTKVMNLLRWKSKSNILAFINFHEDFKVGKYAACVSQKF